MQKGQFCSRRCCNIYGNGTFGVADRQMLVFSSWEIFINFFKDQPYVSPLEAFWTSTQLSDRTFCYNSLLHQSFLWLCITHKRLMMRRVLLLESFQDSSPVPVFPTFYGILEKICTLSVYGHLAFTAIHLSSQPNIATFSIFPLDFFQFHVSHLSLWPTNSWSCPPMT